MKGSQLFAGAVLSLGLLWPTEANAGEKAKLDKSDSKVQVTFTATKIGSDGKQTVTLTIVIDKGWHIYANPVNEEFLEGARTIVTAKGKAPVSVKVLYPVGQVREEKELKLKYNAYVDRVTIPVELQRTVGDTSPLEIIIQVNACNKNICLDKGTKTVIVP